MEEANKDHEEVKPESEVEATEDATEAEVELSENTEANGVAEENAGDEYKEKYYYLAAEMQNMQKRFEREKDNLLKYGNEKVLSDLIGVLDNFQRTLSFLEKEEDEKSKTISEGIQMVNKLFLETLEKHGLKRIDAIGKEFDPNFHEALAQQPSEGKPDMEVIQVFEEGYTLNERVLRAAKVIVVKN